MHDYPNRTRSDSLAAATRLLKVGDHIRFSVVDDDGTKRRSHEVGMQGRRYLLTGMEGEPLGAFATLGAATKAGFAASAEALKHEQE